jgi:hypothetical protein
MSPWLLHLFHRVPSPVQDFVSSRHGARLMRLRYGKIFRRELPRFAERETWPTNRWQQWQTERLQSLLHRAKDVAAEIPVLSAAA